VRGSVAAEPRAHIVAASGEGSAVGILLGIVAVLLTVGGLVGLLTGGGFLALGCCAIGMIGLATTRSIYQRWKLNKMAQQALAPGAGLTHNTDQRDRNC
jgi:hypothetical protein